MVFWRSFLLSNLNPHRIYNPGPTKHWRRRRILQMSAHFFGRRRNCYRLALRAVTRALQHTTAARKLRSADRMELHATRLSHASEEIGLNMTVMKRGLHGSNVALDNHSLADLSIWEPRTFKALANFAWHNYHSKGFGDVTELGKLPDGVILRGLKN